MLYKHAVLVTVHELPTVHAALRLCYLLHILCYLLCTLYYCGFSIFSILFRGHLVTERADRPGLQPSLDTIQVKHVATAPERDGQAVLVVWRRVRLFKFTEATG